MSVEAIGGRIAEIHAKLAALNGGGPLPPGPGPAAGGFDAALSGAGGAAAAPAAGAAGSTPVNASASGGGPVPFAAEIEAAAAKHGIDPALLKALIKQESGFDPNARSPAGASGLTQLMPATARGLGVTNPLDPQQAIEGGAKYLAQMLKQFDGDPRKALAAYNAGPGAVAKYGGIPPYAETQEYVKKVMGYAESYRGASASATPAAAPATGGAPASGPGAYGIT